MKNIFVIISAIVVLIISFLIFTNFRFFVQGYSKVKSGIGEIAGPPLVLISKPKHFFRHTIDTYINLVDVKKENTYLKKKLEILQIENRKIHEMEKENMRLKSVLKFSEQSPNTLIAARVIGEDIKNWFKCIIIDKGRDHGIKEKMPVITSRGIVGQTVEINKRHSKVMVLNDPNSSIDVHVEGKNTRGILEGTGETTLKLKYVLKNDEVAKGDKLITTGKDGIYPKGFLTGIVINIERDKSGIFAEIEAMPFNNFKRLDEILVVKE